MRSAFVAMAFAGICGLVETSASAAITIVSRASTAQETYTNNIPAGQPGASSYNNSNSFTNLGSNNLSLPNNGTVLTSNVTTSLISATLRGRTQANPLVGFEAPYWSLRTQLEVHLTVSNGYADLSLLLNGSMTPSGNIVADPKAENAFFAIWNDVTNEVIFNSVSISTPGSAGFRTMRSWTNASWSGTLGPGSYRIITGADGDRAEHIGPGAGTGGDGNLTSRLDMAFRVPTPGTLGLGTLAAAFAARRRRY